MSLFGWSYPPGCSGTPYDEEYPCMVCDEPSSNCQCPECPKCGEAGNPDCYDHHGLAVAGDSVDSLCEHLGIEPIEDALRAVDKYNIEHIWIVLPGGQRLYYHDHKLLKTLRRATRLARVGVGGIAWDGSDWEWGEEVPAGNGWKQLDSLRQAFHEALHEHEVLESTLRAAEGKDA